MEILEVKRNADKSVQSIVITTPNLVIGDAKELSTMEQSTLLNAISQTLPDLDLSHFNGKCSVSRGFVYDSNDSVVNPNPATLAGLHLPSSPPNKNCPAFVLSLKALALSKIPP